ncbi:hypothetical protein KP509_02G115400 [Ceratopteris richardii]|uniref:ditrans,polycis-polyprenyl diphosphate synthase [(2E,6E)-farnesyldiphosphate specific] n=1 Tax=Ceratopteris richardii TaxID=49495 RepID=A0A8T2V9X3_CERRI|nr:hypothetical protein KP509_02G115400 [Ceratopteris richardii]KAH7445260.1 hypothetical protein KP509_02G115400 [Ceratopteris richardii]
MQTVNQSITRIWCWRFLLLVYSWICFCLVSFFYLKNRLSIACFTPPRTITKRPCHLAVLVDSEDVVVHLNKIIEFLHQLASLGFQHISLYDAEGILKTVLPIALKGQSLVQTYYHNAARDEFVSEVDNAEVAAPQPEGKGISPQPGGNGNLSVELLSLNEGKQAIVEAARNICIKSMQSGTSSDLQEEDIQFSLRQTRNIGPDPDLLLVFSNLRCLQGFPPWRLRLTEIQSKKSIERQKRKKLTIMRI